ncbi:MAG: exodeoxyribonuclease V subunit alpha [Rubricoccaceae bacterium]
MRRLPPGLPTLLGQLAESEDVAAIDLALARLLAEHDPEHARSVALAAALVSSLQRSGHSAVELATWSGSPFPGTAVRLPNAETWRADLIASSVVGCPGGDVQPLVLDPETNHLALYRHWAAEGRIASSLADRLGRELAVDAEALRPTFEALFPDAATGDRQALAAVGALRHPVAIVAGGPGTGKTTTVVKLLALLLTAHPDLEIALATPTGKASDRLARSIAARVADLPVEDAVKERIPTEAETLHRLLRYSPSRRAFGRTAAHPIPADLVVVDETSMADLVLFDALLDALRPNARLVLLGDADQLPSVGAGAVFGDLCAARPIASSTIGPEFAALCEALGGGGVEAGDSDALADSVVRLTVSHRFSSDSGIGALARALRDGDADAVREGLAPGIVPDVVCQDGHRNEAIWRHIEPHARRLCGSTDPADALAAVSAFRILSPTRGGRWGVTALNRLIERNLIDEGLVSVRDRWPHGRPILITANDYDRGLFNGDVGVVWRRGPRPVVLFDLPDSLPRAEGRRQPTRSGGVREVPVGGLPEHETAWAMTVHKAQGSEFDDVLFVLPAPGTPQAARLTRELAYTAVTRAKAQMPGGSPPLTILGAPEALAQAARAGESRASGLRDRLASAHREIASSA